MTKAELTAQLARADKENDRLLRIVKELTLANTQATAAVARMRVEVDALRAIIADHEKKLKATP